MKGLDSLFIFDYGGPVIAITFSKDGVLLFRNFKDYNQINGMVAVAGLLSRVKGRKFYVVNKYVVYLGTHFIGVGVVNDLRYRVFIIGFLRRLISELDEVKVSMIDIIIDKTINHLKREVGVVNLKIVD